MTTAETSLTRMVSYLLVLQDQQLDDIIKISERFI